MAHIYLRVDDKVKKDAEGGKERRTPLEVVANSFYSTENIAVLDKRIADMRAGKNMTEHELIEAD